MCFRVSCGFQKAAPARWMPGGWKCFLWGIVEADFSAPCQPPQAASGLRANGWLKGRQQVPLAWRCNGLETGERSSACGPSCLLGAGLGTVLWCPTPALWPGPISFQGQSLSPVVPALYEVGPGWGHLWCLETMGFPGGRVTLPSCPITWSPEEERARMVGGLPGGLLKDSQT